MSVTPTWATALLSLIGFILLILMVLAWVAMFGDDCGCCSRYGRCCCGYDPCGYKDDEDDIIPGFNSGYDEEHNLAAAESLVDSPEYAYCPHHKHNCHITTLSEDDETHS